MTPCTSASGTPKARLTSAAKGSGIQPRNCCAACKAGKSAARPWGASSARMDRRRMRSGSDMENLRLVYLSRFKRALHHLHALYTPAAVHHGHSPVKKTPASFFLRLRSEGRVFTFVVSDRIFKKSAGTKRKEVPSRVASLASAANEVLTTPDGPIYNFLIAPKRRCSFPLDPVRDIDRSDLTSSWRVGEAMSNYGGGVFSSPLAHRQHGKFSFPRI